MPPSQQSQLATMSHAFKCDQVVYDSSNASKYANPSMSKEHRSEDLGLGYVTARLCD